MSLVGELRAAFYRDLKAGNFNKPIAIVLLGGSGLVYLSKCIDKLKRARPDHEKHSEEKYTRDGPSFFQRLRKLLPILVPKLVSRETGYIALLAGLLTLRTGLSSWIADVSGMAAGQLVSKRVDLAVRNLAGYLLLSIPASYINSALKYFTALLALQLRMNLSRYIHKRYLDGVTFYNICNLGAHKIDNVAEIITVDVEHLCEEFSDIYTSTFKPVMDILFFTFKLAEATTWRGPVILYSYFFFSSVCKAILTPPLGQLSARESELEGDLRSAHERLITNAEEVAFYDGSTKERAIIDRKLNELHDHIQLQAMSKSFISVVDNVIIKYWATLAGYAAILTPILIGNAEGKDTTQLTSDYARNLRYLSNLADAIGSVVLLGNKVNEMKGHVHRVGEVIEKLDEIDAQGQGQFTRLPPEESEFTSATDTKFLQSWKARCDARPQRPRNTKERWVRGVKILEGDEIKFENIDVISPEGKLLAQNVNFRVGLHQNVMITGPNGAGKSSLFRIIGELWPPHTQTTGLITKPRKTDILFIPQKPYLVLGTLRDQVIYPHSKQDMQKAGITDEDLAQLLRIVDPKEHILKSWKWDDEKDWFHAFSGGQKQRVAMARLFYHRPKYAILDECTSAVSDEVEDEIYKSCKALGITLFTVSHRKYLRKHHEFLLTIEGRDGLWSWEQMS